MRRLAEHLNALDEAAASDALERCCGSRQWVEAMLAGRPFAGDEAVLELACEAWWRLDEADWLEAFSCHPRIGDRRPPEHAAKTAAWSKQEQASAAGADAGVQHALAEGNRLYEERFGHVFLICATGRSAEEMLAELETRLENDPADELRIAAEEQVKITRLRLFKLIEEENR